ncbi:monocyte to macrophage differentiation factor [Eurytemora carolleeae]|uniref:monocyte to macrophage differentiation factor n=1 Tax=Eurytemora carolleeae TaxID=1294199 RepID=UPI000C768C2A|nr:monocyte to macrophage differentiation factor [Eurytemora carolleeae]|eukprot:XP_023330324.1 monocyte to macrophage differentiation factor-like [Eurytemora affinis]
MKDGRLLLLVVPTFYLSICLINVADNALEYWAALVYGFVLTGLFTVSTVFHTVAAFSSNRLWRNIFHRMDRAMIYIFIAGSYTPWLHLKSLSGISSELRWAVWVLATLGILYQQIFHEMYKALETFFYVVIALLPSLAVFEMDDSGGLFELKVGGVIYMTGVVFFKCDGVVPLAHAIWHVHVVFGALIHYYAVSAYLIVEEV